MSACCSTFAVLSRAAARKAAATFRRLAPHRVHPDWPARAAACEACPLRTIHRGVSYCGTPFLHRIHRDPTTDGCGCPTLDKAKDPAEHCPRIDPIPSNSPACACKWCSLPYPGRAARA